MLCEDLHSLNLWVRDSRMSFNITKSNVMWGLGNLLRLHQFYWMAPQVAIQRLLGCCIWQGPSLVFSCFGFLQENGIIFILDQLPSEKFTCGYSETSCTVSCTVSSSLCCVCLGAIFESWLSRLGKMFNHAIRVVYGLRKFDHVSTMRRKLGWLSVQSLIQHHCLLMLYRHYHSDVEILYNWVQV